MTKQPKIANRRESRLLTEISRLRPHYQSSTALDVGRRQLLDHFEQLASAGRADLPEATEPLTQMVIRLQEALCELVDGTPAHHLCEEHSPMTIERAREIRALAGLNPDG